MQSKTLPAVILILTDARGIYIPRDFLTDENHDTAWLHCNMWGLNTENSHCWYNAQFPESESYWDDWLWVCDNAEYKDSDGSIFRLQQDGDLWGICYEKMTDEEKTNFGFELDFNRPDGS